VTTKERLHRLVDELPDDELQAAERFLEYLRLTGRDPFLRALLEAPVDDEPLSTAEEAALAEAEEQLARGEGQRWEEVRQRLDERGQGTA